MRTQIVAIFLLFLSTLIFGQEKVFEFENKLKIGTRKINILYTNSNSEGESLFLIPDSGKIATYLYSENFEPVGQGLLIDNVLYKYPQISSFIGTGKKRTIFLRKANNKKWGAVFLDFDNRSVRQVDLDFKHKGENFINEFSRNGFHYVVALLRNSSTFRMYRFDQNGDITHTDYNLSSTNFTPKKRRSGDLSDIIEPQRENFKTNVVEEGTPLALNTVNEVIKLYPQDDKVRITLDMRRTYTFIIDLFLESNKSEVHIIERPSLRDPSSMEKTNSFLQGDHLFSFKTSYDELLFAIIDLKSKNVLKEIRVDEKEHISFSNTPIIQEGGALDDYRELDRTRQFLRKTVSSNPAVAVLKNGDDYVVTLGASQEIESPGVLIVSSSVGGAIGAGIVIGIGNAVFGNYLNYTRTKTARIQTILNREYDHLKGAIVPVNIFDRIQAFELELDEEYGNDKGATTLFKNGDDFILGFYHRTLNTINLYRFKN
ncbi:hypothetical protein EAX61_08665 [Dokdonia sinensis]|uniref:Uncharacterized protein n=1 Tax=Dokdonia sinensis TaxID=2479847 RepID=A0A3M0G2F6_9FLAO|nr:hypothetical protein [Dokdonia sinensis]RMB59124.1 hypothetical protein EAX61_08665 [Dokdonia sinensis]